ncbi:MAG: hypothetical protein QM703_00485 [Gemmatales bacterium]
MYKVLWEEDALEELSKLWLKLKPIEINAAIKVIERQLSQGAEQAGESRSRASERILIVEPLCLYFSIEYRDRERTAVIQHVWPIYKPSR